MKAKSAEILTVRQKPGSDRSAGLLHCRGKTIDCRLGKNGITTRKKEGDNCTPTGSYRLLFGWFRKDRNFHFNSPLPFRTISRSDGWCDDPQSSLYNRAVRLPFEQSHEVMHRDDRLYDVCVVIDHNIYPRKRGAGSAIFFHLTNESGGGTAGCVAVSPYNMKRLLPILTQQTILKICA